MNDYDVIVRIPIRETDMRDAWIEGSALEVGMQQDYPGAELVSVECTGPSEE